MEIVAADSDQPVHRVRVCTPTGGPRRRARDGRAGSRARPRQDRRSEPAHAGAGHDRAARAGRGSAARDRGRRRRGNRRRGPRRRDRGRRGFAQPAPGLRVRRRGAGLADVHDRALPLRPGLVEHAGGVHRDLGSRDPIPGRRSRSRASPSSRRTSTWPVATPTTSSCWPSSTTSSPIGTSTRKTATTSASSLPRIGSSSSAAPTTSRTPTSRARSRRSGTRSTGSATSATSSAVRRRPRGSSTPSATTRSSLGSWPTPGSLRARGPAGRSTSGDRTGSEDPSRMPIAELAAGEPPRMQFPMEFDWIAPSGRALLTSFMADHYSAGWWMDAAPTLEEAEAEVHRPVHGAGVPCRDEERAPAGRHGLHAAEQMDDGDPAGLERALRLAAVHRSDPARVLRRRSRGAGDDRPPVLAADPRHEPDLHRQGRVVHRHQAGPADRREHAHGRREVRHDREPPRCPLPDRSDRQGMAAAAVRSPPRRDHRIRVGPGLSRSPRRLARGRGAGPVDVGRGARPTWAPPIDTTGDGSRDHRLQRAVVAADGHRPRRDRPVRRRRPRARATGRRWRSRALPSGEPPTDARMGRPTRATIAFLARDVPAFGYRTFRAVPSTPVASTRRAGGRSDTPAHRERRLRSVGRSGTRRRHRQPRRQADGQGARAAGRGRQRAARLSRVPEPPAVRGRSLAPDARWTVHFRRTTSPWRSPSRPHRSDSASASRARSRSAGASQEIRLWHGVERVELTTSAPRLPRPRPPVPGPVPGGRRRWRARLRSRQRRRRPAVRASQRRCRGGPVHPRPSRLQLVRPRSHGPGRHRRSRPPRRPRLGPRGRSASPRSSSRTIRARTRGSRASSSRSSVRASRRRSRNTTAAATASSISIPTCPTSGWRSVVMARTGSSAAVLDAADPGYRAELERQLGDQGWARLWVPEDGATRERAEPIADLRGPRDLPVLIVAGVDPDATTRALEALVADLEDSVISVEQPAELDGMTGNAEDYTLAILNRGMPSFNVEAGGNLYLSIMRSCSGWPSGVWIDPPRRATPDGANFQFQHWSHRFEYAVTAASGDWRRGGIVRAGHDYNNPLIARSFDAHTGPTAGHDELHRGRARIRRADRHEARRPPAGPDGGDGVRTPTRESRCGSTSHPAERRMSRSAVAGRSSRPRPRTCSRRMPRRCAPRERRSRSGSSRTRSPRSGPGWMRGPSREPRPPTSHRGVRPLSRSSRTIGCTTRVRRRSATRPSRCRSSHRS